MPRVGVIPGGGGDVSDDSSCCSFEGRLVASFPDDLTPDGRWRECSTTGDDTTLFLRRSRTYRAVYRNPLLALALGNSM